MRHTLWVLIVVALIAWIASFLLDFGGTPIRSLLAMAIIVLCVFVITGRRKV